MSPNSSHRLVDLHRTLSNFKAQLLSSLREPHIIAALENRVVEGYFVRPAACYLMHTLGVIGTLRAESFGRLCTLALFSKMLECAGMWRLIPLLLDSRLHTHNLRPMKTCANYEPGFTEPEYALNMKVKNLICAAAFYLPRPINLKK